ncbi:hypothetical protein VTN96DRAFT_6734 [Rasamsonia emersonii]
MSQHNGGPDPPPAGAQPAASMNGASSEHSPDSFHSLSKAQYNATPIQPKPDSPNSSSGVQYKNPKVPLIPKLSPATTELIARITSNKATEVEKQSNPPTSFTGLNLSPSVRPASDNSNMKLNNMGKIKMSSAILPLPPPPFASHGAATAVPTAPPGPPVLPSQQNPRVPGLVNIAPKPAAQPDQSPAVPPQSVAPASVASSQTPSQLPASRKKTENSRQRKEGINGSKQGKKRKRNEDSDDDNVRADDSSSESNFPIATRTKSGRQVNRPSLFVPPAPPATKQKAHSSDAPKGDATNAKSPKKKRKVYRKGDELNVTCAHCQRGHSPPTNMIVFCDGCNRAWHQFCHDPPIEKEVIEVKEAEWFCRECRPVEPPVEEVPQKPQSSNDAGPVNHDSRVAEKLPGARVGGKMFSAEEKRGYLSGLSHAALVDLLMSLSDRDPTLSIFPSNLKDLEKSKFFAPAKSTAIPDQADPSPAVVPVNIQNDGSSDMPQTTEQASSAPAPDTSGQSRRAQNDDDSEDSGSEYEFEEHRLYPRAGNGFRLPPESEDLDMLLDDPACPTFSHALHGVASIGGAA